MNEEHLLNERDDPYDAIVRYYDAENAGRVDDFPVYELMVERFGGPVLDVGCGTGRVAFHIARQGTRVVGIDRSAAMLERARERAAHQKGGALPVEWHQADATSFALDETFGLAIITYNTFMHFIRQDEQIAVLTRIATHLKPGGGLVIDLPNPVEMFQAADSTALVLERIFTDPETGYPVMQQSVVQLNRATQVMEVLWLYDRLAPDGGIVRTPVPLQMRYTMAAEMRLLLERTGFSAIEFYGDYDFGPYDEDSSRLLVIATREDKGKA